MRFYEQLFDWSRKRGTLAADVSRKPFMNAAAPLSRNAAAFNGTCNKSESTCFITAVRSLVSHLGQGHDVLYIVI